MAGAPCWLDGGGRWYKGGTQLSVEPWGAAFAREHLSSALTGGR